MMAEENGSRTLAQIFANCASNVPTMTPYIIPTLIRLMHLVTRRVRNYVSNKAGLWQRGPPKKTVPLYICEKRQKKRHRYPNYTILNDSSKRASTAPCFAEEREEI